MLTTPCFPWHSAEEPSAEQQKSRAAASSMASKSKPQKGGGSGTGGGSNGGGGKSRNDSARPGSWIVNHDPNGLPYWINDVSGEATYHLFTPNIGMDSPIRHVGNDQPHCLYLPITPLPSSTIGSRGGNSNNNNSNNNKNNKNNNKSNSKNNKNKDNNDDAGSDNDAAADDDADDNRGSHDAARSGGKTKVTKSRKGNAGGGSWEEKYHPITGVKSWYHTGTKKITTKDPFF